MPNVLVVADTVPSLDSGLSYFIYRAVNELAALRPSWRFKIVAMSTFRSAAKFNLPNVEVVAWDDSFLERSVKALMLKVSPALRAMNPMYIQEGTGMASYLVSKFTPTSYLRSRLGDLKALYSRLASDYDLIWLPHYTLNDRHAPLQILPQGKPVLFTIHDIHPAIFPDDWTKEQLGLFWKGFAVMARQSRVITHSQAQKSLIAKHFQISPEKIATVPLPPTVNAEDLLKTYPEADYIDVEAKYHLTGPFAFWPASTVHTHKNHIGLFLAWAQLKESLGPEDCPKLVCTTRFPYWPVLKSVIDTLGIQDKIVFTDSVPTSTLAKLYHLASFVIVPSLYEGGGSGPVAEAIITGRPLAYSTIPMITEQLDSLGISEHLGLAPFMASSVSSIVQAVTSTLNDLPEMRKWGYANQSRMANVTPKLWRNWTEFYANEMEQVAEAS